MANRGTGEGLSSGTTTHAGWIPLSGVREPQTCNRDDEPRRGHLVNAVRRSSLPESGHGERERKRSHSTDDKRRGESRAATASADRKKDRRDSRARGSEDTTGVLEMLKGVVTVNLPGYNPEDPGMDPRRRYHKPHRRLLGWSTNRRQSTQRSSKRCRWSWRRPARNQRLRVEMGRRPTGTRGWSLANRPIASRTKQFQRREARATRRGTQPERAARVWRRKSLRRGGKDRRSTPAGKEEEEKGTLKLLLKRVLVQVYQQQTKDQETPATEASRPSKPTAIVAAPASSEAEATGRPAKETRELPGKAAAKPDQGKARRQRTLTAATSTTDIGSRATENQAVAPPRAKGVTWPPRPFASFATSPHQGKRVPRTPSCGRRSITSSSG